MKILMVAPYTGGIDVYVLSLVREMKKMGHEVYISGSIEGESAYNKEMRSFKTANEVLQIVEGITKRIDFGHYDIVAFHYGKNDIEMLIPTMINKGIYPNTKFVYYVHFLSRNLFKEFIPNEEIQNRIEKAVFNFFDGYVFFGQYAKDFMEQQCKKTLSGVVSFLPETHSSESGPSEDQLIYNIVPDYDVVKDKCVILPGFAANYKDHELLLDSFGHVKNKLLFVFAGPGWRKRIPNDLEIGNVSVRVVDKYLSPLEYKVVTEASVFGVFPYRQPKIEGEFFQGSGTAPNFIFAGKASIALNEGAMPEYVGNSGIVVEKDNPADLAAAIDTLLSDKTKREALEQEAIKRRDLFSIKNHSQACLRYFESLTK